MKHRQKDIWDQPWVLIAVVVGVVAVLAIALVFSGSSGGSSTATPPAVSSTPTAQVTTKPAGSGSSAISTTASRTTAAAAGTTKVTLVTTTPVSIPVEGVFVKVSYIGGFSGSYGTAGALEKITSSGDRVYAVNTSLSGPIQATFQKRDASAKHDLIVEIWKGGKAVASQKNSSAFGLVSISS